MIPGDNIYRLRRILRRVVDRLVTESQKARARKDYKSADFFRDILSEAGFKVEQAADGSVSVGVWGKP